VARDHHRIATPSSDTALPKGESTNFASPQIADWLPPSGRWLHCHPTAKIRPGYR
jgi:hypothetical protein